VLAACTGLHRKEEGTIDVLAKFHADSAQPLEKQISQSADGAELSQLYGAIKSIETEAVASTRAVIAAVDQGDSNTAQALVCSIGFPQLPERHNAGRSRHDSDRAGRPDRALAGVPQERLPLQYR